MIDFGNNIIIYTTWTALKTNAINNFLSIQYDQSSTKYTVFTVDGGVVRTCNIYLSTIPNFIDPDAGDPVDQTTNDSNKTDFENNYKTTANANISNSTVQRAVLSNTTVTAGGSQIFSGISARQVNLFINCTQAFTGSSPGIQFTIQEVDPGNQTTAMGTTVTGASITSGPNTQELTLNLTTSSTIKVSWIIVGSGGPTFPGVYATLITKPTTVFSGVDVNGVERVFRPDTSGRLLVSGSNAIGAAVTVDPVIVGGVNPGGVAGYSQLASDNSIIVNDGGNYQPIFVNATVNSSSISNLLNIGDGSVYLFINIKNAPTGTNPTLTFSLTELDPNDRVTTLRTTVTGAAISAAGTQVLCLPNVSSSVVKVAWTIGGTSSPTFTGVYVSAICKTGTAPPDLYGHLYHSAVNSMVFEASTATSGVAPGTSIGTTAAFSLFNPKTSTKNLVVQEININYVSGTLGSGAVYLVANTNPAAANVTGTTITPVCTYLGSSVAATGQAFTTATLPASPTMLRSLWTLTPMLATSIFQPFVLEEMAEGRYVIAPGCSLSLEAVAAAGTTPKVVFSMTWIEVPL